MSSIWESGNPVTVPPRGVTVLAGLVLAVIAGGSLALGLMTGWQRGESHEPGAAAASSAVEATPLTGPEVTLRSDATPHPPQAAEAPKTDAPAAAPAAEAPSHRVTEGAPDEEAPPPTVSAPPPSATPQTGAADTPPPATTPDAPATPPAAGGQSTTPAAPF